jgi:hypothetical protein
MKKKINKFTVATILICTFVCFLSPCFAQSKRTDNGIGVSDPKPFDNRTLTLKLEELDRSLAAIQVIDSNQLAKSIGLLQGYQTRDVSRSGQLSMVPIPGLTTSTETTLDTDAQGNVVSKVLNKESSTRNEFSLTTPELPAMTTAPSSGLTTGYDSETLLTKQIDLMYQRFGYQLFLERALSDRVIKGGKPRLQAVMGFNIDLSPPEDAKNKAAFVEIEIHEVDGESVSLVAMMPQEKTYNSFKVSTKSNSFGGAAAAKVFTLGYSERRSGQTFYLYQDADTVTFQKRENNSSLNEMPKFGWEFRPVLGRESVSSGMRQMYAVIALPKEDGKVNTDKVKISGSIRTYWRKYNRNSQTTDDKEYDERKYAFTNVEIPTTDSVQKNLQPQDLAVDWYATDNQTAVVSVKGKNLFSGTNVLMGNRLLTNPETGLVFKSDQSIMMKAPLSLLAQGDAVISGRYGEAMALQNTDVKGKGVAIHAITSDIQTTGKISILNIKLKSRDFKSFTLNDLGKSSPNYKFLIGLGDTAILPSSRITETDCDTLEKPTDQATEEEKKAYELKKLNNTCLLLQAAVPSDTLKNDVPVTVSVPFMGSRWRDTYTFFNLTSSTMQITRLGGGDTSNTTITIFSGRQLYNKKEHPWRVVLDKIYTPCVSSPTQDVSSPTPCDDNLKIEQDKIMILTVPTSTVNGFKNLVVLPPFDNTSPISMAIPEATPAAPKSKPKLTDPQVVEVDLNNYVGAKFTGEALNGVKQVVFGDVSLPFTVGKDNKEITIYLLPPVTDKKGRVQLLLKADSGDPIPATIIVK